MKKQFFLLFKSLLLAIAIIICSNAQSSEPLKLSLDDCVQYSIKNSTTIKNATLDEEIAAAKVREVRGIGLPQVNGSAGLQHFLKLRNSYLPGDSPLASLPPGSPVPDVLVLPAIFQLPTNLDASITASQILFSSSYIVGLQAANTYKQLAQKSAEQTKEQVANNVKKAYLITLINIERMKIFDANIARLDSSLKQLKVSQKNGFVEQIEVDRLEVSLNNLLTEYEKTLNLLVLSSLNLKFQMGMPIEQDIILTDSLSKFSSPSEADFSEQPNIKNKAEYQLLKLRVKGEKLNLKNNYAEALPTLVLSGSIGTFSSSNNFNIFQDRNIVVLKNLDGTSAPEIKNQNLYWSTYSLVQLGLNVPIFSGLSRSSKVQQSKLNLQKAENTLKNYEEAMNLQLQTAKVNLQNSQKSLVIQKRNVDLAQNVSNVTYKKYLAGVGSSLEVTNAESSLKEAQVNYFNALFDYLVNKIDYEQAAGLTKF